jgi:hypothetical protein
MSDELYNSLESMERQYLDSLLVAFPMIKKECKPILDIYKSTQKFIYRGISTSNNERVGIKYVRKDRNPKDTRHDISRLTDDILEDTFGWRPRTQGLYTSGDRSQARAYGDGVYVVFPIGKLEFLWSSKYKDSYDMLSFDVIKRAVDNKKGLRDLYEKEYFEGNDKGSWEWHYGAGQTVKVHPSSKVKDKVSASKVLIKMVTAEQYDTTSGWWHKVGDYDKLEPSSILSDILWVPEKSFFIWLDEFVTKMIDDNHPDPQYKGVFNEIMEDLVIKGLDYKDKNLPDAIKSGREIIFNCDKYYYVSVNLLHYLETLLGMSTAEELQRNIEASNGRRN